MTESYERNLRNQSSIGTQGTSAQIGSHCSNININPPLAVPLDSFSNANNLNWYPQWPIEMSNTMQWSAQLLHPAFNLADPSIEMYDTEHSVHSLQ